MSALPVGHRYCRVTVLYSYDIGNALGLYTRLRLIPRKFLRHLEILPDHQPRSQVEGGHPTADALNNELWSCPVLVVEGDQVT